MTTYREVQTDVASLRTGDRARLPGYDGPRCDAVQLIHAVLPVIGIVYTPNQSAGPHDVRVVHAETVEGVGTRDPNANHFRVFAKDTPVVLLLPTETR